MRALLVVNPNARRALEAEGSVREALRARAIDVVELASIAPGTQRQPIDAIVVAGGDGTIANVVPHALAFDVPIGVIPLGTFNELAHTLGLPFDIDDACNTFVRRQTRSIDVAYVNGRAYLSEASIGISSRLARLQTPEGKRRFGVFAVLASLAQAFAHARPIRVEVRFDGHAHAFKTVQLTVANSNRFGGLVRVGDAAIDDGWLDLFSIEIRNVVEALAVARALHLGRREGVPGLRTYRAVQFDISTRRPHRIVADGDPAGTTPARFTLLSKALRVLVPE